MLTEVDRILSVIDITLCLVDFALIIYLIRRRAPEKAALPSRIRKQHSRRAGQYRIRTKH